MTIDVEAIYENGVLKLERPLNLPERAVVRVTIETPDLGRTPLGRRLLELRSRITGSGVPPLSWDEIEEEVAARRGGWREAR
jgi:predicted DNA-binding antitoxin AbrB/MazE fold protein